MRTTRWWAMLLVLFGAALVRGQDPQWPGDQQRAEHLARMKDLAASIQVLADAEKSDSAVQLVEQPVLRYADDTRQTLESSLWIWSSGGRPSAILALEYHPKTPPGPRWLFEIASLSTQKIAAKHADGLRWTAKEPGLVFAALADADSVADKAPRRLAQMKKLRDRFTAYEKATVEGRIELRSLAAPLHRYESTDDDIVDGAIFAFCNGTNPEVLLILEAHKAKAATASWRYALVQTTGEPASAQLDGKQVWERGDAHLPAVRDGYVNGWLPAKPEIKKE